MDRKKLGKLKSELSRLRRKAGNVSSRELESLAKSLGRELYDRGKTSDLGPVQYLMTPDH